jgi:hypothetical protein
MTYFLFSPTEQPKTDGSGVIIFRHLFVLKKERIIIKTKQYSYGGKAALCSFPLTASGQSFVVVRRAGFVVVASQTTTKDCPDAVGFQADKRKWKSPVGKRTHLTPSSLHAMLQAMTIEDRSRSADVEE